MKINGFAQKTPSNFDFLNFDFQKASAAVSLNDTLSFSWV